MKEIFKMMVTREQLEKIYLNDDPETETGGTSCAMETADEFTDTVFSDEDQDWSHENKISLDKLNTALHECGIMPITVK